MPESKLDLVCRLIAGFNARDLDALIELCDPEVELDTTGAAGVSGGVYRQHDGIRAWHHDVDEAWAEVEIEPQEYCDLGEDMLVCYRLRGRGRQSGIEVEMQPSALVVVRDALVVRLKTYTDRELGLGAARVTEDDLMPLLR